MADPKALSPRAESMLRLVATAAQRGAVYVVYGGRGRVAVVGQRADDVQLRRLEAFNRHSTYQDLVRAGLIVEERPLVDLHYLGREHLDPTAGYPLVLTDAGRNYVNQPHVTTDYRASGTRLLALQAVRDGNAEAVIPIGPGRPIWYIDDERARAHRLSAFVWAHGKRLIATEATAGHRASVHLTEKGTQVLASWEAGRG